MKRHRVIAAEIELALLLLDLFKITKVENIVLYLVQQRRSVGLAMWEEEVDLVTV